MVCSHTSVCADLNENEEDPCMPVCRRQDQLLRAKSKVQITKSFATFHILLHLQKGILEEYTRNNINDLSAAESGGHRDGSKGTLV